jgi:serine/threonine-protein kinase
MLLYEAATGPITAPVDVATAPTGVISQKDSSTTSTSALPVLGAAAAGASGAAAANADGPATTAMTGAGSTLSRADALAAERTWVPAEETYDDEPADEPDRRGRSPWTWPLIALILLVLFALVGFLLTQQGILFPAKDAVTTSASTSPPSTSASPTRTSQSATPTPTQTSAAPTPTIETVNIIPEAYLGGDYRKAQSELSAMGLDVTIQSQVDPNSKPDSVIALSRTGGVEVGSPVTITYAIAPPPAPTPTPTQTTAAPRPTTAPSPSAASALPTCNPGQVPGLPPTCAP